MTGSRLGFGLTIIADADFSGFYNFHNYVDRKVMIVLVLNRPSPLRSITMSPSKPKDDRAADYTCCLISTLLL